MKTNPNSPPKSLTDNGLNLFINEESFRTVDLPIQEVDIEKLIWHFDLPVWDKDGTDDWNLTPREVIDNDKDTINHRNKIEQADISYPIIITEYRNNLVILDGIHRLVKVYESGGKNIKAKIIPEHLLRLQ